MALRLPSHCVVVVLEVYSHSNQSENRAVLLTSDDAHLVDLGISFLGRTLASEVLGSSSGRRCCRYSPLHGGV